MPICSYVVIPERGRGGELAKRLARLPGCQVTASSNRELLLLVTDTGHAEEEAALREALSRLEGVEQVVLSFGELPVVASDRSP